jgi:hypothetical protein
MSNSNVEIRVFGSREEYASLDSQDEPQIAELIRDRVLSQSDAEYFRVDVKVKRRRDRTPQYLVAYLLRRDVYLAEVVRVNVDSNFQVGDITYNYEDSEAGEEEEEEEEDYGDQEYEDIVDFVAATPVDNIPSAKAAVEEVYKMAVNAGFKAKMLLGSDATLANYKKYLASGLKGFEKEAGG